LLWHVSNRQETRNLRVRITEKLSGSIDGIQLERFTPGFVYDVGTSLGCYLLSLEAAQPVADETPALVLPLEKQFFAEASDRRQSFNQPRDRAAERRGRPKKKMR
jgi:hypothetical protein